MQENIRRAGRNVSLSLASFLGQEMLAMLPLSAPIWIAGLWGLVRSRYRALAFAWLIAAAIIFSMNPRVYYLFPAFPVLFAAGSVQFERWLDRPRLLWVKAAYCMLMVLMGALLMPTMLPILPPETYIRYVKATHLEQPRIENHKLGPLPQLFADQFGWEEMTATVAKVYYSLPADIRARTAIFGQNYGQAGAIDLFGPKYGLPPAARRHRRECDRDGRQPGRPRNQVRLRLEGGARGAPLLHALRTLRRLLLPRIEGKPGGSVAQSEELAVIVSKTDDRFLSSVNLPSLMPSLMWLTDHKKRWSVLL